MELTLTAKVPLYPSSEQALLLQQTVDAIATDAMPSRESFTRRIPSSKPRCTRTRIGPCGCSLGCGRQWPNR
jgi:hypothetical protein